MSPEELLKPRYKVINTWPGMHAEPFGFGQIVTLDPHKEEDVEGFIHIPVKHIPRSFMWQSFFDFYPHLFEPLPWWKDRKVEDMPEYVKITGAGCSIIQNAIVKVEGAGIFEDASLINNFGELYVLLRDKYFDTHGLTRMNCNNCIPATVDEYNTYLQNTNQLKDGQ